MKYEITRACGHFETVELFGKVAARESKIKWYEKTVCRNCYNAQNNEKEVEMPYGEYKKTYATCKTKAGSYDKKSKTIVVFVPLSAEPEPEPEMQESDIIKEMVQESGYTEEFIRKIIKTGSAKAEEALQVYGEKAKAVPDKTGRFTTAYDAMAYAVELLKKYGF